MISYRAIVLARSHAAARSLSRWPNSPFMQIFSIEEVLPLGGMVCGVRGMHNNDLGLALSRGGLANSLTVAWNLHPSDPANKLCDFVTQESDPASVVAMIRPRFFIPYGRIEGGVFTLFTSEEAAIHRYLPQLPPLEPLKRRYVSHDYAGGAPPEPGPAIPERAKMIASSKRWDKKSMFALVRETANNIGVDPGLALAVADEESGFDPKAVSPKGAMGVMQLMPATAETLKITDPFDPYQNVPGGVSLLRIYFNRYHYTDQVLSAYRSGPGNLTKHGVSTGDTRYIDRVLKKKRMYDQALAEYMTSEFP